MTNLSPAAQAVQHALYEGWQESTTPEQCLAAALRALAMRINGADAIRQDILDIADELEGQGG
jgi:hypothetical protein